MGRRRVLTPKQVEEAQELSDLGMTHRAIARHLGIADSTLRDYIGYSPNARGPRPQPARDGDKQQARKRTITRTRKGEIPPARELACVDCGQPATEYDHFLGYDAAHHDDVEPVCKLCHVHREMARGAPIGRPRKSDEEKAETAERRRQRANERRRARRAARKLEPPPTAPLWMPKRPDSA